MFKVLVLPSFYPMDMDYPRGVFFKEQTELINRYGGNLEILYNEARSLPSFSLKKLFKFHFQNSYSLENNVFVFRKHNWNILPTKFKKGQEIWVNQSLKLFDDYVKLRGIPDLLHVHCALYAGVVARKIQLKYKIPYIVTEHSTFFATKKMSVDLADKILEVYNNAEKVITVSSPFKLLIQEKVVGIETDMAVIPNFIDTDFFIPDLNRSFHNKSEINLLCTCYHESKKNLSRLIEAFSKAYSINRNLRLTIGGEGSETAMLKREVNNRKLEKVVTFPGFLNRDQVKQYLKNTDLFVLASDHETFGVVLIEAMSMGIPVVSTNSGGPEDFVKGEVGFLVEKNADDLADAILSFTKNEKEFNSNNIRDYVINNFSGQAVARKYLDLYHEVTLK